MLTIFDASEGHFSILNMLKTSLIALVTTPISLFVIIFYDTYFDSFLRIQKLLVK